MEGLEKRWKQLKLTTEEENDIVVDEELLFEELRKGKNSVIGKVHTNRYINKEVLCSTMAKAWRTTKLFSVRELQASSFIIFFDDPSNLKRVLSHKPWLFDSHLLSLKPLTTSLPHKKWNS